jgi:hypothetical protein
MTIDDLKIAQYRLFSRETGINFFKGKFERAMDNLFLINPDEYPEPEYETRQTRNCIVGCFLVYHDEGKGFGYDHIRSFGIDFRSEKDFLKTVGEKVKTMHHRANLKNLLGYWNNKIKEE